jgi:hypothetical protein
MQTAFLWRLVADFTLPNKYLLSLGNQINIVTLPSIQHVDSNQNVLCVQSRLNCVQSRLNCFMHLINRFSYFSEIR